MLRKLDYHEPHAKSRSLRFAHERSDGHVGFNADHIEKTVAGVLEKHPFPDRFALMSTLARFLPDIGLEIDGVRLHGHLHAPDLEHGRCRFVGDGALGHPTRPHAWLRWTVGDASYLAECVVRDAGDGSWLLDLPRAVESHDHRLLPRWRLKAGWRFEPAAASPPGMQEPMVVEDLSPVGAGLFLSMLGPPESAIGHFLTGTLRNPRGDTLRVRAEVVRAELHPELGGTRLGVAFMGLGFAATERLVSWLPSIEDAEVDPLPEGEESHEGRGVFGFRSGHGHSHGHGHGHGHSHGHGEGGTHGAEAHQPSGEVPAKKG